MWHVWETGEMHTGFWLVDLSEGDRLEGVGIVVRIIIKWISRKWDMRAWTGLILLAIGTDGGSFECGNEPSGSMKCEEFLD
jgi:hypothetical protein